MYKEMYNRMWRETILNVLRELELVFSKDFNVGATLEGVRFVNPFAREFVLEDWV